ncbi:MAG: nucleotide pyrophosphohydrolase [Clostridiales bacterium]|nr:nucleotide pyrophosphohydrolase [Clostridiales bacterium]
MKDLKISDMMKMQQELWEKNKDRWSPIEAKYGRNYILWLIEELGETIAIIKKKGDNAIMENENVRVAFLEELSDVLMYYIEILRRYHITPCELSKAFIDKHIRNMKRDFFSEYSDKYEKG